MCERSGWTLTNLQLQKILYLAQMVHLGTTRERLFSGQFEAWDYGPVHPLIYGYAKTYGRDPIRGGFFGAGTIDDAGRRQMLDNACDQLSTVSAGQLVSITHIKDGAWAKFYQPGIRGIKIPDEAIIDEYNTREARR